MGSARDNVTQNPSKPAPCSKPVVRAHVDYTEASDANRLKEVLPEEAERLRKTPYTVIQVGIFTYILWGHSPIFCIA